MVRLLRIGIVVGSILFAVFQLVLPVYAFLPAMQARAVHLGFMFFIVFAGGSLRRADKTGKPLRPWRLAIDLLLAAAGIGIVGYVFLNYQSVSQQYGIPTGPLQVAAAFALTLLVLEAARREIQPTLPIIAMLFLLYALFGHRIPGTFGIPRYGLETIAGHLFLTTAGLWGMLVGVSTDIIAIFVFFGAVIFATGGGTGFMRLSVRLAGRFSGGPAKVATVASALFGSISGSASANVATTGSFTIPMMRRLKYKPEMAAAVEATASTGGQIMPPIMGAGAFVLAELTETPYLEVVYRALIPAICFFAAVGVGIHFYAKREGYTGLDRSELPSWAETVRASVFFLLPFVVLMAWMVGGYTPQYAAFWATLVALPLSLITADWKLAVKEALPQLKTAAVNGARQAAVIAAISASAQVIISVIAMTGLGVKISTLILSVSQGQLFLTLVLIALTSIVLGMQVPTTAAYIMAVVVGGPVLITFGLPPIAAHLFVFYFAILSAITPPICGAVFISAGMAEADWFASAKIALKLSFAAFFVPFVFVYDPALLLIGSLPEIAYAILRTAAAVLFLAGGLMCYWRREIRTIRRGLLLTAGVLMLFPIPMLSLAGAGLGILLLFV
ncbi:MAG: TRAP transporter fused permease subunit [Spirochaetaceae bacterium]|nr:MAG: TRAP transporter fused permease subunit [Spirochaetaceae bacterium]